MAKAIIEALVLFLIFLTLLTQVIIPLFLKKVPLFWLFRNRAVDKSFQDSSISTLNELETEATESKEKMDNVKQKIFTSEEHLNKIKNTVKN